MVVQKQAIINFGSDGKVESITIDGRTYTGFVAALGSTAGSLACTECRDTKTRGSQIVNVEIAEGAFSTVLPAYTLIHGRLGRVPVSSHT
jgi:allantoicase